MKRPSEVPPVVDSSVCTPVSAAIAAAIASDSSPRGVRNGSPPSVQSSWYSSPWRSRIACTRAFSCSGVLAVEKRKLKSIVTWPGITLVAPVPAWMFDICQVVGGKYALPSSQRSPTSSASAGAARWIGLRARCG